MKSILKCLAGVCLLAGLAQADVVVFDYSSVPNGTSVAPATGAATFDNFMVTSWIFGEVSVAPDLAGQPIVGQGVFISNPTANPISFGILFGLWAADGPDGGPGTMLNVGLSGTTPFPPSFNYESVDSGFPTPAGNFWVGYAFENYATPTTTAAELDSLQFDMGATPTVGTSVGTALLGSAASYPLGNDPAIAGPASGALAQFLQVETPEPSSALFAAVGILLLAGAGLCRKGDRSRRSRL